MSRITRDGTAELVSRDKILRCQRRQGHIHYYPSIAGDEPDWQPYPVDLYSADIISDGQISIKTSINTHVTYYIHMGRRKGWRPVEEHRI